MAASVETNISHQAALISGFDLEMENYNLKAALDLIKEEVAKTDKFLAEKQPWKKEGQEKIEILETAIQNILDIAYSLQIFMPETAAKILTKFQAQKITALEEALFPRL
jgi:methionyl-tRNA synthetase